MNKEQKSILIKSAISTVLVYAIALPVIRMFPTPTTTIGKIADMGWTMAVWAFVCAGVVYIGLQVSEKFKL